MRTKQLYNYLIYNNGCLGGTVSQASKQVSKQGTVSQVSKQWQTTIFILISLLPVVLIYEENLLFITF